MTYPTERKIITAIKKTFGATYEMQKSIWDKLEAKHDAATLQNLYNIAEDEKVSQSFREMMMRG
jgi:predicted RNA binding protein with dsRBD fold (UPF0201 family)